MFSTFLINVFLIVPDKNTTVLYDAWDKQIWPISNWIVPDKSYVTEHCYSRLRKVFIPNLTIWSYLNVPDMISLNIFLFVLEKNTSVPWKDIFVGAYLVVYTAMCKV